MSKPVRHVVDPVRAAEQFKADLAAMQVGPKPGADGKAAGQRQQEKLFGVASYKFNRWSAELEEAQTLADALDPAFWAGQADKMMGHDRSRPRGVGDIIELRKPDTGLYAELIVTEIGKGFVRVTLIARAEPEGAEAPEASPLTTKWNAGAKTHDVVRRADGQVLRAGFQTKASAVAWIAEHLAKVAA
ncbi:MAG: hypothetical protein IT481_08580 [Gammaproteobacteria bacterium]|nr:hypothetical protein [Gammaproteobacteria bacterium]